MIKFIQTADIHLGLEPDKGSPWSEKRKKDIFRSFVNVVEQVKKEQADLLLIPGDLFHRQPLKRELKEVSSLFAEVAPAHVVLIAGNHDYLHPRSYYRNFPWPENVHMLMDEQLGKIRLPDLDTTVWGCSFWKPEDGCRIYRRERIREPGLHILLGQGGDEKHHPFSTEEIREAGYDYAAFGHIHRPGQLVPDRIVMSGALEPTDCNDFGPHGYWSGTLSKGGCRVQFHSVKNCEYKKREIPVTPKMGSYQILEQTKEALADREPWEISHVIFTGRRDSEVELPIEEAGQLQRVVKLLDKTQPDYQYDKLKEEHKGTLLELFIREMESREDSRLNEEALYYGVHAILEAMER